MADRPSLESGEDEGVLEGLSRANDSKNGNQFRFDAVDDAKRTNENFAHIISGELRNHSSLPGELTQPF